MRRTLLPVSALLSLLLITPVAAGGEGRVIKAFTQGSRSVVPVHFTLRLMQAPEGGQGTKVEGTLCGVVADEEGMVITTADVFPDPGGDPRQTFVPSSFSISLNGREFPARAMGLDRERNLAFLRVDNPADFPASPPRYAKRAPRPGEQVLLIGLMGELHNHAPTFTEARIVGELNGDEPRFAFDSLVQDLTIGGLTVNMRGEALGIVGEDTLPSSPSGAADLASAGNVLSLFSSISQGNRPGYPVLFPYRDVLEGLLISPPGMEGAAAADQGWLGIIMQPLSNDLADYWQVPGPGGVIVGAVMDGSPAESAGLQVGDIILEVGDNDVQVRELRDLARFRELVQRAGAGEEIPLAVFRDGERAIISLTLGSRPKTVFLAEQVEDEEFGLTVKELTFDFLQASNAPSDVSGVFVSEVENAGWADVGGVQMNDIITAVQGEPVAGLDDFRAAMARVRESRPAEVVFFVRRGTGTRFIPVQPDW